MEETASYLEAIEAIYEDSVHTADERVCNLESDTLDLLIAYQNECKQATKATDPDGLHKCAQANIWQLLSALIASTADKGIYLSENFVKKYDKVEFVGDDFGNYVRDTYDVRKWKEPQHETRPEPQQTINAPSWENLTDDEKWLFHCKADYDSFINSCTNNKPDPKGVADYYIDKIHNIDLDSKWGARKELHKLLKEWGIVKVKYEHFNRVLNQQFKA